MTYSEARAKAIAGGIAEEELTAEDVRAFGYEVIDPTSGVTPPAAETAKETADNLALLRAEGQANGWTRLAENIFGRILKTLPALLAVCLCVMLAGCVSTEAQRAVDRTEIAVQQNNEGHLALEDGMIVYYVDQETAKIEEVIAAGRKSHYKTVEVTEKKIKTMVNGVATEWSDEKVQKQFITPEIAAAYERQRAELYGQMQKNVAAMRAKQATICRSAATAAQYLAGLKQYFTQKAETYEAAQKMAGSLMDFLDKYLAKTPVAAPAAALPTP